MKFSTLFAISFLAFVSFSPVFGHVGRGFSVPHIQHASTPYRVFSKRAMPTNMGEMAKIYDESKACNGGDLANSSKMRKVYPKDNNIASILDDDDEAKQVWQEIKDSGIIPQDVSVKKGVEHHMGVSDETSDSYDNDKDPDCWWTATMCTKPKAKALSSDIYACPEPKTYGLTFDDGPNCTHNKFYDFLKDHKLRATMFFIGANVFDNPLQAQRALADGHDVCVHTWSHHYMTTLSDEQVFAELYYTIRIIKDVMGVTTQCWRPPFGDVDDRVRAIAAGLGLRTVLWSNDTDDWNITPDGNAATSQIDANYESIASKAAKQTADGVIVLSHELINNTMGEFMKKYSKLEKNYQHITPLTACMNVSHPYQEEKPVYPTFDEFVQGKVGAREIFDINSFQGTVASRIKIEPLNKQTAPGHFSNSSPPPSKHNPQGHGKTDTSSSSSNSSDKSVSSNSMPKHSPDSSSSSVSSISPCLLFILVAISTVFIL